MNLTMNKEEYPVEEKSFIGTEGIQITIVHSNLGRRYRKLGETLHLMPNQNSAKLEDSLSAMIRLQKENMEIDRKLEIEKVKLEAKREIEQLKLKQVKEEKPLETQKQFEKTPIIELEPIVLEPSTKIKELEKELALLKQIYENKVKERLERQRKIQEKQLAKEKQLQLGKEKQLAEELEQIKEKIQLEEISTTEDINITEECEQVSVNNISDEEQIENYSEINESETYTELIKQQTLEFSTTNDKPKEDTTIDVIKTEPSTSRYSNPRITRPDYTRQIYDDRSNTLWNSRLNTRWKQTKIPEQANFLDLDCIMDTNKTIQLWIGSISKQLVDNKISILETPGYIERTLLGTVKLWFHNLSTEAKTTLRNDRKSDGTQTTSNIDILQKYEYSIRNEFGSMTTEIAEQEKDKNLNRQLMNKLMICNMCYIDEYTCAFKEYYYKGIYTNEESREIRKLYFTKLPEPFSTKIEEEWNAASLTDTLGARIKYLQIWFIEMCNKHKETQKLEKILGKNMACCTDKTAPQFGCKQPKRYKDTKYKYKSHKYKSHKFRYKYRQPRKRYYVKNYKSKRPYKPKKKLSECKCYNCGKLGHLARNCKIPKDPKKKQIQDDIYTELPYIDFDMESEDSLYQLEELDINDSENDYSENIDECLDKKENTLSEEDD